MNEFKDRSAAAQGTPPSTSSQDVYKTARPRSGAQSAFARAPRAAAGLVGGLFEATAAGFREFREHLDDESILRFGVDNGVLEGAVAASGRFFEGLAQVSRDVYSDLKSTRSEPAAAAPIDYERLARMVAAELKKPGATPATPPAP